MKNISPIYEELGIDLTVSEKSTFFRFLGLYLGSSFVLMLLVTFFYFQNEKRLYFDLLKSDMQNITSKIASEIIISHMQVNSFDKEIYIDSGKYKGSFESKKREYLESKEYKISFYDNKKKKLFGSLDDKIDFTKKITFNDKSLILIDSSTVGHLGIEYIVIKDQSFEKRLFELKVNILVLFLSIYFIIALIGFYLAKLFLKPIKDERIKLNNFIKDTTHELNTPITALLMSTESETLSQKQIQRVKLSANRISEIYKDLSYIILEEHTNTKEHYCINLETVIKEQLLYFEPLFIRKKITVVSDISAFEYCMAKNDCVRLLNNMLSNAIKYNNMGGNIIISLDTSGKLTIGDTGIGIEQDKIKDIFTRYFRATSEQGGFGIGLNIVRHVCTRYDIKIDLQSTYKKGTTFTFKF